MLYLVILNVLIQFSHENIINYEFNFQNQTLGCNSFLTGFKCSLKSSSFSEEFCKIYSCPNNWRCIDLNNGFFCKPFKNSALGRQHKSWLDYQSTRDKRLAKSKCKGVRCQTGAVCDKGKCRCLKHYTSQYCDEKINYCKENSCTNMTACIPRLGGFTCACPPHFAGKHCNHFVQHNTFNMIRPEFLHQSFQYVHFNYFYIFYAQNLGFQPEVHVDFGDGTVSKRSYSSVSLKNAFDTLIKYFQPPLNIKSNQLEAYTFEHTYKKPKIYSVKVRAWNGYYEIYNTEYEIQVRDLPDCKLEVTLHNAALDKASPLQLYRENIINIMSAAWSNCMQIKLEYQWQLFKVKSFEDDTTSANVYPIDQTVDLQHPNLEIPSFTLEFGNYVVTLFVEMVKPKSGLKQHISTWFTINRKPIIAHIEGGHKIWVHTQSMFFLDASLSYDPNYGKNKQPPLTFSWNCDPSNKIWKRFVKLNETGPVLIVPANILDERNYTFRVWVNNADSSKVDSYTGISHQEVQAVTNMTSFYMIRCLRNCIGGYANPMEVIALRGICIYDPQIDDKYKNNWIVYSNPDTNKDKGMRLDNAEFSKDDYYITLYQQQLQAGQDFKFVFSGYNTDERTNIRNRNGISEFFIKTYDVPEAGDCLIYPEEGYGMLTTFTIFCKNFIPSGQMENESLLYEVTQFSNLHDRASSGAFAGYAYNNIISNLTLAPGHRINDYITTLRITAINNYGLSTFFECNATVFPLIYYFKEPSEVIQRFVHIGTGSMSPLNLLLVGGNYLELVQQIISTTFTLEHFLNSQDSKYMEPGLIYAAVDSMRDDCMSYLYQVPVTDIKSVKHIATALDKVINLPSKYMIWKPSIILGISILKKLINKLEEKINVYDENILLDDLDDIGIILVNIASNILKIPTTDSEVVREDITDTINILARSSYVNEINPYNISSETLTDHDSNTALKIINQFVQIYMTYKVPNERTTLITSSELSVLMKKAAPEFLTTKSLTLAGRVTVRLLFDKSLYGKNAFYNLELIVMDNNPNWYTYKDSSGFKFPFVNINITNEVDGSPVDADLELQIRPINPHPEKIYNGSLPIDLFWKISEKHIQVHRIIVSKGQKLLIEFFPIKNKHRLQIVIKKNIRPKMSDFWYNGINIPQNVPNQVRDKGLSVFVDDNNQEEDTYYYLGILPHIDTLKELMKHVEEPILPHAFHYEDEMDSDQYYEENYFNNMPSAQLTINKKNNSPNMETLPYSFIAHGVQCVMWNQSKKRWTPNCNVKPSTTSSRIVCNCSGHNPLTVNFNKVSVRNQPYTELNFYISYYDNPLIVFLVIFTFILFIGLFHWAVVEDYKDKQKRTVCFLVDNYPHCEYCYVVIVYTGRKIKSGTTSNVTIELEGTNATSLPHVLKDWTHEVLGRGYQDWFVLKTKKPLGEIYCLHIWTDYSGSRPSWYCEKIIIQDIQEQQVWFFNIGKWFDPIHGNGTMSYTIYETTDRTVFSTAYHFRENIEREFDSGMHGWFSIFFKHPYSNYTRKQRVAVAYLHMSIMMVILILLSDVPMADSPDHQVYKTGWYEWEINDLLMALYTVILAFPIHNVFVWLFCCIKPSSQWIETGLDEDLSRFNIDVCENDWIASEPLPIKSKIRGKDRQAALRKQVSFSSNFFEPEGQRKLRSKYSLQKLIKGAGQDKVVPLRIPMSKVETDTNQGGPLSPNELNSPVYGREVYTRSYCFPPCFLCVAWILLLCIVIPSIYIIVLYGISYGWVFSLHYLTSLFLAIVTSIFIVEPLKLLCWSFYLFMYNRREYSVEDRSDLVQALNPQFVIPLNMQDHVTEKINILRESDMYTPLAPKQIRKFKRNRFISFVTRMIIADFMLIVLFILLLSKMINDVFDPLAFLQYQNVKQLVTHNKATRRSSLENIYMQEDLVYYLNDTLINNLQYPDALEEEGVRKAKPIVDEVNYLVGIIRFRQVRKPKKACNKKAKKWAARCVMLFDNNDYGEGWTRQKNSSEDLTPNITVQSWLFVKRYRQLKNFILFYNESKYPSGAYTTALGKTKIESHLDLDYLAKKKWFDYLTTVIYIDLALYNPNIYYLSLVTLIAERGEQGLYYTYDNIRIIKMNPVEHSGRLLVLIFLFALFVWLMVFVNRESTKYSLVKPTAVFSTKWNRMKKVLLVLGIINVSIYVNKILQMDYYQEKIARIESLELADFESAEFWEESLRMLIAFMLFLVILDLCNIFNTFYRVKLFLTILSGSEKAICAFLILLLVLIVTFTWTGYILYGSGSYNFQSFSFGFYTIYAATHRNFKIARFGNFNQISYITFFYYLALVISICFIFHWLMATIIIHSHHAVKSHAQSSLHGPLLSNYAKKYFDTIDSYPNRKPIKRDLYLQKMDSKMRVLGFLFVDLYNRLKETRDFKEMRKPRALAMDAIALEVLKRKHKFQQARDKDNEKYRRKEQAKALARNVIFMNVLNNKLDYLNAKLDILIREERYQKILLSK